MKTPQQRAAETRKNNRAGLRLYEEVTKPAHAKVEKLMNSFLLGADVRVKYVGNSRLKGGVTEARLAAIDHGGLGFTVHIDGYKAPQHYASSFWELI